MGDGHFIAINYHNFHNEDAAIECVNSVKIAADKLVHSKLGSVRIVFFNHSKQPLSAELSKTLSTLDIDMEHAPCSENGTGLNTQIRKALDANFDFFYRVDADDSVFSNRFKDQSSFFAITSADFVGGALLYQNMATGDSYLVAPRKTPKAIDYILNNMVLHPTLAMRLSSFKDVHLLYWDDRLEDKEFMLSAIKEKMVVLNDQRVYGTYNYNSTARSSQAAAILNLKLNIKFISATHAWHFVPVALCIFGLSSLFPSNALRKFRYALLHRKKSIQADCDNNETIKTDP